MVSTTRQWEGCPADRRIIAHHVLPAVLLGFSLCFNALPSSASSALETVDNPDPAEQVEKLQVLREELLAQQTTGDSYNPAALALLQQLGEILIDLGDWSEAASVLEQQIHIIKVEDGLYSTRQYPLIHQQLGILAAQQDWDGLADKLHYLGWLIHRGDGQSPGEQLQSLKQARDWARLLLLRGSREVEAHYLLQLQTFEESAVTLAREQDLPAQTMQQLIYDQALAELYIALGIVTPGETSVQLVNRSENNIQPPATLRRYTSLNSVSDIEAVYGARSSTMVERAHRMTMGRHKQLIGRLADLYLAEGEDLEDLGKRDPETAAVMQLFLGDSVLLRQQYELRLGTHVGPSRGSGATGSAASYYKEAWELLLAAGYTAETLNDYFSCPALLPLSEFSTQLEAIRPVCQRNNGEIKLSDVAIVHRGIPGLRYENVPGNRFLTPPEGSTTLLRFRLGVNGQVSRIEYQEADPDSTGSRIRGRDALRGMQFRPALQDGSPIRLDDISMRVFSLEPG